MKQTKQKDTTTIFKPINVNSKSGQLIESTTVSKINTDAFVNGPRSPRASRSQIPEVPIQEEVVKFSICNPGTWCK